METEGDEVEGELKPQEKAKHEVPVEDRNEARRARAMQVDAELGVEAVRPVVRRDASDPLPSEWEEIFSRQGGFMEELLGEGSDLG